MRRFAKTIAAALVAAAFFSPAFAEPLPPVFPFEGTLREASAAAPAIFSLAGDFRLRSISRASPASGSGFLGWDGSAEALRRFDAKGNVLASWAIEAAFAWVSGPFVLTRARTFSERSDAARGFAFSLYRVGGGGRPRLEWTATLDCFPSDVVFAPDGAVYLCGADHDDAENAIYRIDASTEPKRLLSVKKKSDFLRLVECDGAMLAFSSAREKTATEFGFFYLGAKAKYFARIEATGLPGDARCAYGYGFAYNRGFIVPVAMDGGDVALIRLEAAGGALREGGALRAVGVARGAKGCYLPLGLDPADSSYLYLARDADSGSGAFFLGRYDGSSAKLEKIE